MMEKVFEKISREEIYTLTGNQFMQINSLYQLYAMLMNNEETLEICDKLLFMPDLFNFFLTGKKCSEYTIASTSQLLNATKKEWDKNIFQKLGLPINIMAPVIQPGSIIDKLLSDIAIEVGLSKEVDVVSIGCHDTASAVAAVPAFTDKWAFISSGTWSVIGIELNQPLINKITMMSNFTNEGGIGGKIRFLQNVIGLWLLQECRKSWEKNSNRLTYDELIKMASKVQEFKSIINPDDNLFLNPPDMLSAIKNYCIKTRQPVPESIGEYVRCIFESLALKYKGVIKKIDSVTKSTIETIHIVGGGSQNEMLNQLTANACGLPVAAGPVEATALGNIIAQALAKGTIQSIQYGKELIARSFPIKMYKPSISKKWDEQFQKIYPFK
jgi:rhamnulokinase